MTRRLSTRTMVLIWADIVIILGGFYLGLLLRLGTDGAAEQIFENFGWLKVFLMAAICLVNLYLYDLYDFAVINSRRELVLRLVQALGITWVLLAVLFYFFPFLLVGRGAAVYSVVIILISMLGLRIAIHYLMGHPELGEKILIVGNGSVVTEAASAVSSRRDAGYRIVGFMTDERLDKPGTNGSLRNFGVTAALEDVVQNEKIDRIVIGVRERRGAFPAEPLLRLRLAGNVNIEESSSFFERVTGRVHLDNLLPSWLIFSFRPRDTRIKTLVREGLHRGLALIGLIVSFPIAILVALLVRFTSRGPIFYKQERVGKNGKVFRVIKFRSMRADAESDDRPVWASTEDDRTTLVGGFLRKTRLDEIPQFWNILKGEMSFVGPRPERPFFVAKLAEEIPFYEYRHLVAPGLTGWAQIKFPYGSSVEDAKQKLQYDLYYIKNQNLTLDIVIVFETVKTVLFGRGGR
ncbi:MAG: TIGR03013 family PEP-CTERM/XrtA system glycosyltransferase [Acidobacteria bacterium]|nr:TIGR03013 family PEP-CTERM/XrtA system glycosyltransferase [Acidobacteriota bacterium]